MTEQEETTATPSFAHWAAREVERLLRQAYPSIDLKKCWIFEIDRRAEGGDSHYGLAFLSALLAAGALFLRIGGSKLVA